MAHVILFNLYNAKLLNILEDKLWMVEHEQHKTKYICLNHFAKQSLDLGRYRNFFGKDHFEYCEKLLS